MQVVRSSRIVMFDVDETLIIWDWSKINPDGVGLISITDPQKACQVNVMPHERHITLMKQFKARGHTIVVWSQGGYAWAEYICQMLGIEGIVDIVMDKPSWYVDDLSSETFMKVPIYLDPTDPNKDKRWGKNTDKKP